MPLDYSPEPIQPETLDGREDVGVGASFRVVGVGASAGGLEALIELVRCLPANTGVGLVIVQHLAPERESSLVEILARATAMPVCEVGGECGELEVERDHVYVIPPGSDMIIAGGRLRLLPQERRPLRQGIDDFFRSLAHECGHQAIGVILSGDASDGTLGIEAIKDAGGITFAQDQSAQHQSMPRSAISSGCVDFVLSPEKIAREIAQIARRASATADLEVADADGPEYKRILEIVQLAKGVDFSHYKVNTTLRRLKCRMMLQKLETLQDYREHLERVPEEVEALYQGVLIRVTNFFRDPEAFEALSSKVFPKLLEGRSPQDPLRIWTIGCATGEEAYSLAIAFTECVETTGSQARLQLFGTDLNNNSLLKARAGFYPKSVAQDLSPERLRRFFTEEGDGYRIAKFIRERCVFSRHNLLRDPPFSRVDLISCRNLLIYLDRVLHHQILPLLHYSLKPAGVLFLGSSESVGASRTLFDVEDAHHKIFVRRPGARLPAARLGTVSAGASAASFPEGASPAQLSAATSAELHSVAERILLTKYAPPGVVVSSDMEIVQFHGDTGAYLAPAAGAPSLNLWKMLREGLLLSVRAAILRAEAGGSAVREEGLRVKNEGGSRELAVEVIPIKPPASACRGFLILFDDQANSTRVATQAAPPGVTHDREDEISRLTRELAAMRQYLQSVIEQQESANEELQSAVEEAQSANEELQSVNEELETSKEEIQSSNEELATVNDELNHRSVELSQLNHSLQLARDYAESIVASVRWPLVVLDAVLRVKTVSRAFGDLFCVAPEETEGRLIYDLGDGQWNIPALRLLLENLLPRDDRIDDFEVRHTFESIGPRIMLLNARRLTQSADHEPLIVLAIEDITERRAQEDSLLERASELTRADRSKNEFLAMLAHELRNPLASLRNATEILHGDVEAEVREQALDILVRQIENMTRMIDDLLDVSRITEGKVELRTEVLALDAIITAAASLARPGVESRRQKLTFALPAEPVFLNGDATRLDQVFGNLLANASKYSEPGGHIFFTAERAAGQGSEPPQVIVRVRDSGIGIAPELLPRVFDLFVQASRGSDRAQGGLGIGLTVVQRLVKMHGGSVEARSKGLGQGSEFIVRLPILQDPAAPSPASAPPARDRPRRILIVDDNEDSARSMSTLQQMRGHETRVAYTGPDGLAAALEFVPEIVLLDIGLPGMDGFEVARRLRMVPSLADAFLVAMTGYDSDEDRLHAREAGFDEYLVKPVETTRLRGWMQNRA